ncbi:MAG: hypothetical protein ACJ71S_11230 [Acidobacteriaceae bacterium]
MRKFFPLIECVALACCVATAQTGRTAQTSPPVVTGPSDRISDALAVLTFHLEKTTYKRGDPIRVAVILSAGPKGAYFPGYFGDFNGTCAYGFAAAILTDKGTSGDLAVPGCATGQLGGMDSPQSLASIRLGPAETRTWNTTLQTRHVLEGAYTVVAEYLSFPARADNVVSLQRSTSLFAIGRVIAKPVPIVIR